MQYKKVQTIGLPFLRFLKSKISKLNYFCLGMYRERVKESHQFLKTDYKKCLHSLRKVCSEDQLYGFSSTPPIHLRSRNRQKYTTKLFIHPTFALVY